MVGVELAIADPETAARVGDGGVGEVWLRSPCVTAGYYGRPELSAAVFQASLGFAWDSFKSPELIVLAATRICIGIALCISCHLRVVMRTCRQREVGQVLQYAIHD